MTLNPDIFRDYDIRAIIPDQMDETGIKQIAQALVKFYKPKSIQVGRDMRVDSPKLQKAFIQTFLNLGVNVVDLGLTATDMIYFAGGKYKQNLAINVNASHNPPEYNGMKMVQKGAIGISGDSGIYQIRDLALKADPDKKAKKRGRLSKRNILPIWVKHVLKFVDVKKMKPFKVVIDAGNGIAGYFMPAFEKQLPWKVTRLYYKLDGTFPNHIPSPIELKNMQDTIKTVKKIKADVGMAFDGDGDRVYLVDEKGRVVSGTIMTAIIAENLLQKHPQDTILYNAIIGRIVPEIINKYQGKAVRVRVGHTLIKEAMRKHNGLFCGEHSGHYFFRENYYADSAIIAALLVLELMSIKNVKLSTLVNKYNKYSISGEINFETKAKKTIMKNIEKHYQSQAQSIDWLDGVSVWFDTWWANVRPSNTEPLLRLNIEADNQKILDQKIKEFVKTIRSFGAKQKK